MLDRANRNLVPVIADHPAHDEKPHRCNIVQKYRPSYRKFDIQPSRQASLGFEENAPATEIDRMTRAGVEDTFAADEFVFELQFDRIAAIGAAIARNLVRRGRMSRIAV